ncbi:hypothetical protein B0T10DRAFT_580036 [Thelonectria olida]|uniref:Uncharacterized protein n=1 Tax=Thelonectria olida TaxID=1576542 RepID=A0A9P8W082_9HYPO|nr:hypothetical protein B0T10DRAFT_580036 [Thelonectria olida]
MCHTVIAQRMCKVCRQSLGETVIDFTHCARKCSSFLLPHARTSNRVLWPPRSDSNTTYTGPRITCGDTSTTSTAAAAALAGIRLYDRPFAQAATFLPPEVTRHAAAH